MKREPIKPKQIDEHGILKRLKDSGDKEAIRYIKVLNEALKRQQELTNLALSKIRQLSKTSNETKNN